MDIKKIIQYLDNYLISTGRKSIDPVKANELLAKARLLSDSKDRPGKPLRDLLRKGKLPHAYQSGGKGTSWIIPHSSKKFSKPSNYSSKPAVIKQKKVIKDLKHQDGKFNSDIKTILEKIEKARLKFKPEVIKCLIIAEAPPDSLDRFFYFENVKQHDYLFLGIAEAIYPELKEKFLLSKRSSMLKTEILNKFKSDGFYLLDLSNLPLSLLTDSLENQLPLLKQKIEKTADKKTNIVLIKANVFDIAYNYLNAEGFKNVANNRIPFPGQGGQRTFQVEFKKALTKFDINDFK